MAMNGSIIEKYRTMAIPFQGLAIPPGARKQRFHSLALAASKSGIVVALAPNF